MFCPKLRHHVPWQQLFYGQLKVPVGQQSSRIGGVREVYVSAGKTDGIQHMLSRGSEAAADNRNRLCKDGGISDWNLSQNFMFEL
jgi:hypothetical protein